MLIRYCTAAAIVGRKQSLIRPPTYKRSNRGWQFQAVGRCGRKRPSCKNVLATLADLLFPVFVRLFPCYRNFASLLFLPTHHAGKPLKIGLSDACGRDFCPHKSAFPCIFPCYRVERGSTCDCVRQPRSPCLTEISPVLAKSPLSASLRAGAWSLRAAKWIPTAICAPLSLASKLRFPATETAPSGDWFECGAIARKGQEFDVARTIRRASR